MSKTGITLNLQNVSGNAFAILGVCRRAMERAGNAEMDDQVERKGLGTPATRASIIEKLVSSGYATVTTSVQYWCSDVLTARVKSLFVCAISSRCSEKII